MAVMTLLMHSASTDGAANDDVCVDDETNDDEFADDGSGVALQFEPALAEKTALFTLIFPPNRNSKNWLLEQSKNMAAPKPQKSPMQRGKPKHETPRDEEKEGYDPGTTKCMKGDCVVSFALDPETKTLGNGFEETFKTHQQVTIETNSNEETLTGLYYGLKQLGCSVNDTKAYFKSLRKANERKLRSILRANNNDASYQYLSKLQTVTSVQRNEQDTKDDAEEVAAANDTALRIKLNHDFDEWSKDDKAVGVMKQELAKQLGLDADAIQIEDVERGSVIMKIRIALHNALYKFSENPQNIVVAVPGYQMRPNDQIEIKYKNNWYKATVSHTNNAHNRNGIDFVVRYNRNIDGSAIFWVNSETQLNNMRDANRLRVPGQQYTVTIIPGGANIQQYMEPGLAAPASRDDLQAGDHFYARIKRVWYRCQAISNTNTHQGHIVKFHRLVDGDIFSWKLWTIPNGDISFQDERQ